MGIIDWVYDQEIRGNYTFSQEEVVAALPDKSKGNIKTTLGRLIKRGRLQSVYNGFYVIVPVHYQLKGVIPPTYYIDNLMRYINKPYYISLLSAAAMHGAAHQRAMYTQIMTVPPRKNETRKNPLLDWNYRQNMPTEFLLSKNAEMGGLWVSSLELTTIDLVQFAHNVGGYQRAATVLAELCTDLTVEKIVAILPYTTIATIQRLGYLLEYVLEESQLANDLYSKISQQNQLKSILLDTKQQKNPNNTPNRWHVNANVEIEIDELW